MMKVKMKVSGGFRSNQEAEMFCAVRGYLSTASKNVQRMLAVLRLALAGKPCCPPFISICPSMEGNPLTSEVFQ